MECGTLSAPSQAQKASFFGRATREAWTELEWKYREELNRLWASSAALLAPRVVPGGPCKFEPPLEPAGLIQCQHFLPETSQPQAQMSRCLLLGPATSFPFKARPCLPHASHQPPMLCAAQCVCIAGSSVGTWCLSLPTRRRQEEAGHFTIA